MKSQAVIEPRNAPSASAPDRDDAHGPYTLNLLGERAEWFDCHRDGDEIALAPKCPMPKRCTIRPIALFQQDRGFPDLSAVMGRLVFPTGTTDPLRYRPFSRDPERCLRKLFLPAQAMPDDDWFTPTTWWNATTAVRSLCTTADIGWAGLSETEIHQLVRFVFANNPLAAEPIEICTLHALTQHAHARGDFILEIGSYRGGTIATSALALRSAAGDRPLVSIDPHLDQPHNAEHVRLALRQIGEEPRLIQVPLASDRAWRLFRPESAALILIDGDHAYQQVVRDFQNYRGLLAPGGVMLFHDYGFGNHNGQPETCPDVRRAVDEHVFTADEFQPLLLAQMLMAFVKKP